MTNKEKKIAELRKIKTDFAEKARELSALYEKLYGNIDNSQPMSKEEKELKMQVALLWSQVNDIVRQIHSLNKSPQ